MSFTATCDQCQFSGSIHALSSHDCAHENYLTEHGGRCEDFPACGHTDGDTCSATAEGSSDYWLDMYSRYGDDVFDSEF